MINLVSDTIDRADVNSLIEWLQQEPIPRLTKGSVTKELEERWAEKIGTKYSVYVNSGSSAILLTLAALKYTSSSVLKNNKIVVPNLSWATDVSSPDLLGYDVILADCNLEDLSVDLKSLEKLFIEERPAVFILVSVLGFVPDMSNIVNLCDKYGVILIEDVCESLGSEHQGNMLGQFGLASCYSLYFGHHLSTIEGGFINTSDKAFYNLLLSMRSHGWDRDCDSDTQKQWREEHDVDDFSSLYSFFYPGFNVRSTDLQAYIGLRQIEKLEEFRFKRNINFNLYKKYIKNNKLNLSQRPGDFISNFAYPVVSKNRKKIVKKLQNKKVEVRPLIAGAMHRKPYIKKYMPAQYKRSFPNCELVDDYGFYLPNHQDLTEGQIINIANIINDYRWFNE